MKKSLYVFLAFAVLLGVGGYWYQFVFPLTEFTRLGEIQFPKDVKVLEWENDGWGVKGKFLIPSHETKKFTEDHSLTDGGYVGSDVLIGGGCIHDGDDSVSIRLSKESGIAEIEIKGPDHSGDKPCLM